LSLTAAARRPALSASHGAIFTLTRLCAFRLFASLDLIFSFFSSAHLLLALTTNRSEARLFSIEELIRMAAQEYAIQDAEAAHKIAADCLLACDDPDAVCRHYFGFYYDVFI
jgi:hypothetical protein